MSELKKCPFCECKKWIAFDANHYACEYCGAVVGFAFINYRPLEDALSASNAKLREVLENVNGMANCTQSSLPVLPQIMAEIARVSAEGLK